MKIYLVGGAIRNKLLGLPVHEKDWVVIGAHPEELTHKGYRQVGKNFPVFLHPDTQEEYALARRERKIGLGYTGFSCEATPEVSLEEDLRRRDLSINAIAEDADGQLIDPCGGLKDLQNRLLRHISPAFVEDPLRVLRVARFASTLAPSGFRIADETLELMRQLSRSGELLQVTAERIWKETARALMTERPDIYFQTLREAEALPVWFPEISALFGVPQNPFWHPEIDTGQHILLSLQQTALDNAPLAVRFAVLVHDVGKAHTASEHLPHHPEHGQRGLPLIQHLAQRLRVPAELRDLALMVAQFHLELHRLPLNTTETVQQLYSLITHLDGWRRPQRLPSFVQSCRCDVRGRLHHDTDPYPQGDTLLAAVAYLQQHLPDSSALTTLPESARPQFVETHRMNQLQAWLANTKITGA